jgi:hypothetical protein
MEKIKTYIIIGLTIVIFFIMLLNSCDGGSKSNITNNDTIIVTNIKYDTLFTIEKQIVFKTVYKPSFDTIFKERDSLDIPLDSLNYGRVYNDSTSDSSITIYSRVEVDGVLTSLGISYKEHRHPYLITNTIEKTEYKEIIKSNKLNIYTGLELGGNSSSFNLSPFVNFSGKKVNIQYRYGLLNNTHNIGIGWKIFSSKK